MKKKNQISTATKDELKKYKSYCQDMKEGGIEARPLDKWLEYYRATQTQQKKKG